MWTGNSTTWTNTKKIQLPIWLYDQFVRDTPAWTALDSRANRIFKAFVQVVEFSTRIGFDTELNLMLVVRFKSSNFHLYVIVNK